MRNLAPDTRLILPINAPGTLIFPGTPIDQRTRHLDAPLTPDPVPA